MMNLAMMFRHNDPPRFGLGGLGYRPVDFRGMIGGTSMPARGNFKIRGGMIGGVGGEKKPANGGAGEAESEDDDDKPEEAKETERITISELFDELKNYQNMIEDSDTIEDEEDYELIESIKDVKQLKKMIHNKDYDNSSLSSLVDNLSESFFNDSIPLIKNKTLEKAKAEISVNNYKILKDNIGDMTRKNLDLNIERAKDIQKKRIEQKIAQQQKLLEEAEAEAQKKKKLQDEEAIKKQKALDLANSSATRFPKKYPSNSRKELLEDYKTNILEAIKGKYGIKTPKQITFINSIQDAIESKIKDKTLTTLRGIQEFITDSFRIDKNLFNNITIMDMDIGKERIKAVMYEDKNPLGNDVKVARHIQAEINQVNKLKDTRGWEGAMRTDDKYKSQFITWDIDTDDKALFIGEVKNADNVGVNPKESWRADFNTTTKTLNSNKGGDITDAFPMEITKIQGWKNSKYYMNAKNNTIEQAMVLGHGRGGLKKELIGYFNVYVNDAKETLTYNFFKDIDNTPDKNDDSKLYYRHNTPEGIELRVKPQFKVPNYETMKKRFERKFSPDEVKSLLDEEIQKYSGSKVYYIPYGNLIR